MNEFPKGKLVPIANLVQEKQWEPLKEIVERGQESYSATSEGYSYKGSYYILRGKVAYGDEIRIGKKSNCGCK